MSEQVLVAPTDEESEFGRIVTERVVRQSREKVVISSVHSPNSGYIRSVSCSPTKCVAVGTARSSVLEGHETGWTPLGGTPSQLYGASCASGGSCTGVGQATQGSGLSVAIVNGTRWKAVSLPGAPSEAETNTLNSVSCADRDSCVAVGQFIGAMPQSSKSAFGPVVVTQTDGTWSVPPGPRRLIKV
jgi:hypothetical protein